MRKVLDSLQWLFVTLVFVVKGGVALVLAGACGLAFAQDSGVPSLDPGAWGRDLFSFALPIAFLIAGVKRASERSGRRVPPFAWWSLAVLLGVAGAFGLHGGGFGAELRVYGAEYPVSVGLFGVLAGLVASGFRDFVKGALMWAAVSRSVPVELSIVQTVPADLASGEPILIDTERARQDPRDHAARLLESARSGGS